jgi:putative ABC transport system permease protein
MVMARANSIFIAGLINFDITSFSIPIQIYALEIFAGLIVPLLAGLYPIISGTRITVREAISQSGSNTSFGVGGIEKLLNLLRGLPMGLLYALRNIFRRKVRLALALLTLSIAGAIFVAVISVRASLLVTIDEIAEYWQEDISLTFHNPHRFNKLERQALSVPGITSVEGRLVKRGFRVRSDDTESKQTFTFYGVPVPTQFLQPVLLEGRWLQPDDENSIVLNVDLLSLEPDISVGDEVEFRIEDRKIKWHVVGIVTSQVIGSGELLMSPIAYANYPYLAKMMGETGQADQILLKTQQHDGSFRARVARGLEKHFRQVNLRIAAKLINNDVRTALESAFDIVLSLVRLMSLLFAVVGGLGLMSMMSLNVLERTQEIGIIRVVGGIRKVIAQIVVAEGIFVGVLSWAIGSMLAFPLSKYLCHILGLTLLNVPLTHTFPISGLLLWLVFVIILAAIASILPARNASRLSVRETLTYE